MSTPLANTCTCSMDTNDDSGAEYLASTESIMLYAQFGWISKTSIKYHYRYIVAAHCRRNARKVTVTAILLPVQVPNFWTVQIGKDINKFSM